MPLDNFDARQLRRVLGSFVTGVTVVTTVDANGKPYGLTANSFTSVSLDPPLVLWNQSTTAPSHPVFRDAGRFAINILAEDQVGISKRFATRADNKFEGLDCDIGLGGIPLVRGCAATLECRKVAVHTGGDHVVFIGEVERIDSSERRSLVFGGGKYLVAHPHYLGELSNDAAAENLRQVHAVRAATPLVAETAQRLDVSLALAIWSAQGPVVVRWDPASTAPSSNLRMGVVSVLGSATGRLFAAWLPRDASAAMRHADPADAGSPMAIAAALHEIRQAGHSILDPEHASPGGSTLRAISVPVLDGSGAIVLAVTAVRRADASTDDQLLLRELKATARSISTLLAADPTPPDPSIPAGARQ